MGVFPDLITGLPQANIPVEGVTGYLLQGEDCQVVFMVFDREVSVPAHSHGAQWGVVLAGRIDLAIDGEQRTYGKGDSYSIPAGVQHSATVHAGYADMTVFADRDRYGPK